MEILKVTKTTYNLLSKLVLRDRKYIKSVDTNHPEEDSFVIKDNNGYLIKIELIENS